MCALPLSFPPSLTVPLPLLASSSWPSVNLRQVLSGHAAALARVPTASEGHLMFVVDNDLWHQQQQQQQCNSNNNSNNSSQQTSVCCCQFDTAPVALFRFASLDISTTLCNEWAAKDMPASRLRCLSGGHKEDSREGKGSWEERGERKSMANRLSHVLGPGLKVRQVHLGLCRAVCVIQFSL